MENTVLTNSLVSFRTRAAFGFKGAWRWVAWTHASGNGHAAIIDKARALGADAWDFGNADHEEASRANF